MPRRTASSPSQVRRSDTEKVKYRRRDEDLNAVVSFNSCSILLRLSLLWREITEEKSRHRWIDQGSERERQPERQRERERERERDGPPEIKFEMIQETIKLAKITYIVTRRCLHFIWVLQNFSNHNSIK
ncbi:hypothetical protein EUGRSUZ_B01019 [Eucalyptus grandis]|uniref:Uncharacterized protein n=2 Tax=Eucalyptus grandis TaxID=71139 RepID=A0ACC3LPK8_EUCGR|nr:hypothetical protein EUGRSUZ_B01019 [Eucalyptus grandis]